MGGAAQWYCEPANIEDLRTLVEACSFFDIARSMMGRGSNLIIPDEGFNGLVLKLKGDFWSSISLHSDDSIIVGSGFDLMKSANLPASMKLAGFEFFEGIPGTLGGVLE